MSRICAAPNARSGHLAFEYLKMASGIFVVHVPYRGTGPMLTDLMAGRLQAASVGAPALQKDGFQPLVKTETGAGVDELLEFKRANKLALQRELKLKVDPEAPMFFWPSRPSTCFTGLSGACRTWVKRGPKCP